MAMNTLLYSKWVTNKDLLYNPGNTAQCYVAAWMGGWFGENRYVYMYGWAPLLFICNYHNTITGYTPTQNKKSEKKWDLSLAFYKVKVNCKNYDFAGKEGSDKWKYTGQ